MVSRRTGNDGKRNELLLKKPIEEGLKNDFIKLLKDGNDMGAIYETLGIDEEQFLAWRSADKTFYSHYLDAIGLSLLQDRFLTAYLSAMGNVSHACERAQISRRTYYNWLETIPVFKAKAEEVREKAIDMAESALQKGVLKGNTACIIFTLRTLGKKRGYIETSHVISETSHKFDGISDEDLREMRQLLEDELAMDKKFLK